MAVAGHYVIAFHQLHRSFLTAQLKRETLAGDTLKVFRMQGPDGYGFWLHGKYWGSMITGPQRADGRHDIYIGAVGEDTHEHIWLQISPESAAAMGTRLKDRGRHITPELEGSHSTQAVARVHVTWNPTEETVTTELADVFSDSAHSADPVVSRRVDSSRNPVRVDLPLPAEARSVDCEFSVVLKDSTAASVSSTSETILPFGGDSPLAVSMNILDWGPGP